MVEHLHPRLGGGPGFWGLLKERSPWVRWRVRAKAVHDRAAERVDLMQDRSYHFREDVLDQVVLVLIMAIEGRPADHGAFGDLSDRNGVEAPLFNQRDQRLSQEFLCAPYPQIAGVVRHFAPPVTYVTFFLTCTLLLTCKQGTLET